MEENHLQEEFDAVDTNFFGENPSQFKGIRKRKWESCASEIWGRKSRQSLCLGSYTTTEQSARAYEVAVYCIRGPNTTFNFPDSIPSIPSSSSLSRQQIQQAARRYATTSLSNQQIQLAAKRYATLNQVPSTSSSGQNNNENDNANNSNKAREGSASASGSALVQDSVSLNNSVIQKFAHK